MRNLLTLVKEGRGRSRRARDVSGKAGAPRSWFFNDGWLSVLSVCLAILGWALLSGFRIVPPEFLPGPVTVANTLIDIVANGYRGTTIWQNAFATLFRLGTGFILACATGVPLGLAMGYNKKIGAAFDYIVQFMRPLPPLSYLVLLILWLGTGDMSKIALLYLTAFPIIVSSSMAGVRSVATQKIQVARSLGAGGGAGFRARHISLRAADDFHRCTDCPGSRLFDRRGG